MRSVGRHMMEKKGEWEKETERGREVSGGGSLSGSAGGGRGA